MNWIKEFKKLEMYQDNGSNNDFYNNHNLKYILDLALVYNEKLKSLRDHECEYFEINNGIDCKNTKRQIYLLEMELKFLDKIIEIKSKTLLRGSSNG